MTTTKSQDKLPEMENKQQVIITEKQIDDFKNALREFKDESFVERKQKYESFRFTSTKKKKTVGVIMAKNENPKKIKNDDNKKSR